MTTSRSTLRTRRKQRRRNGSVAPGRRQGSRSFDWSPYAFGCGALLVVTVLLVYWNSPASREYRASQAIAKQEQAAAHLENFRLQREAEKAALHAEEANNRYRSGCTMLANENSEGVPEVIAITAETVYSAPGAGGWLPVGQVVCDDKFVTAVIGAGGMIDPDSLRRGDDSELVNQRFDDAWGWHPEAKRSFVGGQQR